MASRWEANGTLAQWQCAELLNNLDKALRLRFESSVFHYLFKKVPKYFKVKFSFNAQPPAVGI